VTVTAIRDYTESRAAEFYDLACNYAIYSCCASATVAQHIGFNNHVIRPVDGEACWIARNTVGSYGNAVGPDVGASCHIN
jgi:hypothetical protein